MAIGTTGAAVGRLVRRLGSRPAPVRAVEVDAFDDEPLRAHADRIRKAKALIAAGDLYQVNLARRIRVRARADAAIDLFERLSRAAPTPFAALLRFGDGLTVLSTTPELLLRAEVNPRIDSRPFTSLLTAPIKGTRPRGGDASSDAALARALDEDPKERAELAMILDVERHDLGRIADVGSVRVIAPPHVVTHRTLHHRLAVIAARARAGVTREEVLLSMVPSGSVTGAPKVRAMEVIRALEPHRRGLYTGALGFVAHDGAITLAMAIRTLTLRGDEGEYFAGGGIVEGSDPDREVEETRWKAVQLTRMLAKEGRGK
jgi:anthranilate/para-aminobenzoate synthase component I